MNGQLDGALFVTGDHPHPSWVLRFENGSPVADFVEIPEDDVEACGVGVSAAGRIFVARSVQTGGSEMFEFDPVTGSVASERSVPLGFITLATTPSGMWLLGHEHGAPRAQRFDDDLGWQAPVELPIDEMHPFFVSTDVASDGSMVAVVQYNPYQTHSDSIYGLVYR